MDRAKGTANELPLPEAALAIIRARPRFAATRMSSPDVAAPISAATRRRRRHSWPNSPRCRNGACMTCEGPPGACWRGVQLLVQHWLAALGREDHQPQPLRLCEPEKRERFRGKAKLLTRCFVVSPSRSSPTQSLDCSAASQGTAQGEEGALAKAESKPLMATENLSRQAVHQRNDCGIHSITQAHTVLGAFHFSLVGTRPKPQSRTKTQLGRIP